MYKKYGVRVWGKWVGGGGLSEREGMWVHGGGPKMQGHRCDVHGGEGWKVGAPRVGQQ